MNTVMANVESAVPEIFEAGENRAVVQNQDASANMAGNGALSGSNAVVYLTGFGKVDHAVSTGAAASNDPLSKVVATVEATVNGVPANVSFAGLTPRLVGLTQVNFEIPNLPAGTYPLVVRVDDRTSNSALITVK